MPPAFTHRTRSFAAALAVALPLTLHAQSGREPGVELGADAALTYISISAPVSGSNTVLDFPVQSVRAAFSLSPTMALEPALGIHVVGGDGSLTQITAEVGLPISFAERMPNTTQYYVRPVVGIRSTSFGGNSQSQAALGAGVGMRVPIEPRVAARFEARYDHGFGTSSIAATNEFGVRAGLSFYTR